MLSIDFKGTMPPWYRIQSLGDVWASQRQLHKRVCTTQAELDSRCIVGVNPSMVVWPCPVRHAAWLIERNHIKAQSAFLPRHLRPRLQRHDLKARCGNALSVSPLRMLALVLDNRIGKSDMRLEVCNLCGIAHRSIRMCWLYSNWCLLFESGDVRGFLSQSRQTKSCSVHPLAHLGIRKQRPARFSLL